MRADRSGNRKERRRRSGAVSLPFLSRNGGEEGRERKQDKGSVSRHCISACMHILFLGGRHNRPRHMTFEHCRRAPFSFSNREMISVVWGKRLMVVVDLCRRVTR